MNAEESAPLAAPEEGGWPFDRARLREMVANEADMSFKRRSEAVYDFLRIGPGQRVLDLGCGRGFYLNFSHELYPEADVVGIELDRPLLDIARERVPGARVVNGSVYDLPFPDEHFDRILFSEVIEHIPDDAAAMREIARVMAPGAVLALTTPNADYPFWWDPINKTLEASTGGYIAEGPLSGIWANHVRLYRPEDLSRLVAEAGLEIEEARCFTHYCFPFIHNLVYGLGKELLVAGVLPESMAQAADRFDTAPEQAEASALNPVRLGLSALNAFDRLNDRHPTGFDRSYLITALKIRKPERPA